MWKRLFLMYRSFEPVELVVRDHHLDDAVVSSTRMLWKFSMDSLLMIIAMSLCICGLIDYLLFTVC